MQALQMPPVAGIRHDRAGLIANTKIDVFGHLRPIVYAKAIASAQMVTTLILATPLECNH
jgi:hypothetical protein